MKNSFNWVFLFCHSGRMRSLRWIPTVFVIIFVYCLLVPFSEAMCGIEAKKRSTAMGLFQAVYAIGMTTFPIFTGNIASAFSIRHGYLVLAGISMIGTGVSAVYYRNRTGCKKIR